MVLSQLLNELLNITGSRQTEFAMVLNYSPSEISKYVTGTRLPPVHLVDSFVQKSAAYFADIFWNQGKTGALNSIFLVFKVPGDINRLENFLEQALRSAYEEAVIKSGEFPLTHSRFNTVLYGHAEIEDHVLIFLSRLFREATGQESVWLSYSFMRYLNCPTLPIKRDSSECSIVMNLMISRHESIDIEMLMTLMQRWQTASCLVKVVLWLCDEEDRHPFYYLENSFLLLVNETVENMPVATRVIKPSVLLSFMAKRPPLSNRMSYDLSKKEDIEFAQQFITNINHPCRGAYLFTNTMFYWGPPVKEGFIKKDTAASLLQQTFSEIKHYGTPIVVSSEAVRKFTLDLGFHVPFVGTVRFPEDEVEAYLKTLYEGMSTLGNQNIILTNLVMPGLSALVFDHCMVIHSHSVYEQADQLIIIPINLLENTVQRFKKMVGNEAVILDKDKLLEIIQTHLQHKRPKAL